MSFCLNYFIRKVVSAADILHEKMKKPPNGGFLKVLHFLAAQIEISFGIDFHEVIVHQVINKVDRFAG
jgi:hypothetical protein